MADGVKEVVDALNSFSEFETKKINGLIPADVTVVFNITAGKKEDSSASVEIVPTPIVKEISKITGSWSTEVKQSTGNTLTIKFRNILFANEKVLISIKSPEEMTEMFNKYQNLNWNIKK